jgi:penicillin-binding protein
MFRAALLTVKWLFFLGLICGFLGGGAAFGYVSALVRDDPVRPKNEILQKIEENAITGFVYFNDDTPVGQLRSEEDRRPITMKELPELVKNAVLAIEDDEFFEHPGIDVKSLIRAVSQKLTNADVQTGGSTITQQLARRVFLTLDRSDNRKAKEIFLALRLERLLTKDQILLAYLNKIPYGNGSSGYNLYGIKAAAKGIFDIDDLNSLNVAQAAYLAGLPQLPSKYSAFTSRGELDEEGLANAIERMKLVLKRMYEEGVLTQQQYEEALAFDIRGSLAEPKPKAYNTYPYLMLEVERQAAEILARQANPTLDTSTEKGKQEYAEALKQAREDLLRSGYHIYTTIDKTLYDEMRAIAENPENFTPDDPEKGMELVASVAIENKTGAILGMIEGRDFYKEQMNLATQMTRQPGSTMKPLAAYIPAIEKGAVMPATIIDDVPIILKDGQKGFHLPENWDGKFHGLVTARHALNQSYNLPAIKLFVDVVGIEEAWNFVKKLGITTLAPSDYYAQTGVIGGLSKGVTVEELTNAFSAIPNKGVFKDAYMIRKITDSNGKVIYEHQLAPESVFSEETAYIITDMMKTVISSGTGSILKKDFKYYNDIQVAGKTGSTQNDGDAWFVGYSPDVTVGVWAGYDEQKHSLKKTGCSTSSELGCGTQRALKIWAKVMNTIVEKRPELIETKQFERPANVINMTVSAYSGKLPNELVTEANKVRTDIFNKKYIPTEEDQVLVKQRYVLYDGKAYLPHPETPEEMTLEKVAFRRERPTSDLIREISEILPKLSGKQPSIQHYYPQDYSEEAASEIDPRTDDGNAPNPPTGLKLNRTEDHFELTFQASESPDVAGYRLYRSDASGIRFQRVSGKVVLTGQELKFTDSFRNQPLIGYYVTAVDIAGKESGPSIAVYTNGSSLNLTPFDPLADGNEKDNDGKNGGNSAGKPSEDKDKNKDKDNSANRPSGEGGASSNVNSAPSAPKNVAVKRSGIGIEISWSENPKNEAVQEYIVYYSKTKNGKYEELQSTKSNKLSYYSVDYSGWYRVTAVNAKGESSPSAAVPYNVKDD